jgi:hypothetical protein
MPTADNTPNTDNTNDTGYVRVWCATTNQTYRGKTLEEARAARDAGRAAFAKSETPAPKPNPYLSNKYNANRKIDYVPKPNVPLGPHSSAHRARHRKAPKSRLSRKAQPGAVARSLWTSTPPSRFIL